METSPLSTTKKNQTEKSASIWKNSTSSSGGISCIYTALYLITTEYIFFSSSQNRPYVGPEDRFQFKSIEIIQWDQTGNH